MVKLSAYQPFKTAEEALENIMSTINVKVNPSLKNFLTTHLPATKSSKKQKFCLGISEPHLGKEIFESTGITASYNDTIVELIRGIRTHFTKIVKKISEEDLRRAQLGLSHQFSREKCAADINRQDKPITQTIALIEQLDKDINTFTMRLKEWFSWHFPELTKIVNDNQIFAKLVQRIERRENINEEMKEDLTNIVIDEEIAQ